MGKRARAVEKAVRSVEIGLGFVGALMLLAMMVIGAWDVIGRYLFNRPLTGALEISSMLMGGMVFLGWAYTLAQKAHTTVDIFFLLYPPRVQAVLSFFMMFLTLVLFALIAWQSISVAMGDWSGGKLVKVILIPIAPFKLLVSLGAIFLCLESIIQMLHFAPKMFGKKEN